MERRLEDYPRIFGALEAGVARRWHTAGQLYVSLRGEVLINGAFGEVRPGEALTPDHLMLWLSAGKPLAAIAWARLWERGLVRLDDPVAKAIPEFSQHGKEELTWRQVLTHTARLRTVPLEWPQEDWDATIARLCAASLDEDARPGYHTQSTWFLLGELLARSTGLSYPEALRQEVLQPCGLRETWPSLFYADEIVRSRLVPVWQRDAGHLQPLDWHEAPRIVQASPGSNTWGPISQLGRFYETLLAEGQGPAGQVLSPQSVAAMTARHRVGEFDQTLMHVVDFGLGFIIDSNRYGADTVPYGYGKHCSPRTFGHGGSQSTLGCCDPAQGLVVAFAFNGRAGEGMHQRRTRELMDTIYEELVLS